MRSIKNPIDEYTLENIGPLGEIFNSIEARLKSDNMLGINIGPTEGLLLSFFIKILNIKKVLEIGTQYGYSANWILKALPQDGTLVTIEKNEEHFHKAQSFISDSRCRMILGDAKQILTDDLGSETFDMIFIDANKKSYPTYLKYALEHVPVGGIIVADNTYLGGQIFESKDGQEKTMDHKIIEAMRIFNKTIFFDQRFTASFIPSQEGMTIAFRKS